jgi:hypothetical protein
MIPYPAPFKVCYAVEDLTKLSRALRGLREFAPGSLHPDTEEYIWMAPQPASRNGGPRPVATVRLSGRGVEIECRSRHAMHAMQALVEGLGGDRAMLLPPPDSVARL